MDGSVWKLEQGADFHGTVQSMRSTVVTHARRRDIAVKTQIERDRSQPGQPIRWLYLQFFPSKRFADAA